MPQLHSAEYGNPGQLPTGGRVLVVGAGNSIPRPLAEEARATTTGVVRRFAIVEFERELGIDLDDNLFREFEGRPGIVARQVQVTR